MVCDAADFDNASAAAADRSCSSNGSADECDFTLTPAQLLGLAIRKRRSLMEERGDRDYRRELLHSHLIQHLCKTIGEGRAQARKARRRRQQQRRHWRKCSGEHRRSESEEDGRVPDSAGSQNSSPISGFESSVQNADGRPGRLRCWRATSVDLFSSDIEEEGKVSPRKRSRWDWTDEGCGENSDNCSLLVNVAEHKSGEVLKVG